MPDTRIYKVINELDQTTQMVEAISAAQAVRHAASKIYRVDVATTKEVARHMAKGKVVEDAQATAPLIQLKTNTDTNSQLTTNGGN